MLNTTEAQKEVITYAYAFSLPQISNVNPFLLRYHKQGPLRTLTSLFTSKITRCIPVNVLRLLFMVSNEGKVSLILQQSVLFWSNSTLLTT